MGGYKWTEEEVDILNSMYGSASIAAIKRALKKASGKNRTYDAIRKKATKEGLLNYKEAKENLTAQDIADSMGYAKCTVLEQWKRWGLKVDMVVFANRKKISKITAKDFWEFAYKNREKLSFKDYKEGSILPEPDWLKEELSRKQKRYKRELTKEEEVKVLTLRKMGVKNKEIAKAINATTNEMSCILRALRRENKIESRNVAIPFSIKELEMIKKHVEGGGKIIHAAEEVGRDEATVARKVRELKAKGEWDKIGC